MLNQPAEVDARLLEAGIRTEGINFGDHQFPLRIILFSFGIEQIQGRRGSLKPEEIKVGGFFAEGGLQGSHREDKKRINIRKSRNRSSAREKKIKKTKINSLFHQKLPQKILCNNY